MTTTKQLPRVWVNVSTSSGWNRPAVGIVRVERSLAEHLQRLLGVERCKLCVWRDDQFVEWVPTENDVPHHVAQAVDAILPITRSFDLARPFLVRALKKLNNTTQSSAGQTHGLHVVLPTSAASALHPAQGDFIISIGLDWDMPYTSQFYEMATKQGLRIITCCYDLIPVLFPQYCVGEVAQRFTEYFLDLSWGSEAVLCISEQTQRDYVQLCDELGAPNRRSVVIPLGDNIPTGATGVGDEVRAIASAPFILYVSTIERRKNHEVLYRAYHLLARRGLSSNLPKLVFVGMPGWGVGELLKDIELDPLTPGLIVQLNHVTDSELGHLYQHALFCVFPSLYEGWGLPVGEALAVGKAVIASDSGSLPEVGGDLVRYVSAWNPYGWADAIQEYLDNPQLVSEAERRVRSFYVPRQWSDTAKKVGELIDDLVSASSDDLGMTLDILPGYDMSTHCGLHVGGSIESTGNAGLLLFGPHRALQKGRYEARVFGSMPADHRGDVLFEIASNNGSVCHVSRSVDFSKANFTASLPMKIDFTLESDVLDMEIKCTVSASSCLQINRITVDPMWQESTGLRDDRGMVAIAN